MVARRVLLVEDEGLIRLATAEALKDDGFEVIEAISGDEAVSFLRTMHEFDVLMTDVRMPGATDGVELAVFARAQQPDLPVLVVSGFAADLQLRLRQLNPEATFFCKPYRLSEIVAAVRGLTRIA